MNSSAQARRQAWTSSSWVAWGLPQREVVGNGAGKENIFLQNHGHLIPEDLQIILANIYAAHLHYALRGVVQPGNQLDQSGLDEPVPPRIPTVMPERMWRVTLQGVLLGLLGIAEADVLKINGAVRHLVTGFAGRPGPAALQRSTAC